jgi:hypothetical protein
MKSVAQTLLSGLYRAWLYTFDSEQRMSGSSPHARSKEEADAFPGGNR